MDDARLIRQFESRTLPRCEWTHEAHVRVAWRYLQQMPFDAAVERMRQGIQAYNAAHPIEEGPLSGYHETITVAFMRLIAAAMRDDEKGGTAADDSSIFCRHHPELLDKQIILQHYSRPQLESNAAKASFIQPDGKPLPE